MIPYEQTDPCAHRRDILGLIDNCASGGTRTDFGKLRRAGTTVISDHAEDPHICRLMQTVWARVLPANCMNSVIDPFQGPPSLLRTGANLLNEGLRIALEPESACILHLLPVSPS